MYSVLHMIVDHLDLELPFWWVVDDVLSPAECADFIGRFAAGVPEYAEVPREGKMGIDLDTRNNTRVMWDDAFQANGIVNKLKKRMVEPKFPTTFKTFAFKCGNPRLRVYRYEPGQKHRMHWDTEYEVEGGVSKITVVLYLNENYSGGRTSFPELEQDIEPKIGRALLFQQRVLHEARSVEEGSKYVLRTDLIYS